MVRVAIIGATGYTGAESIEIILRHREAELVYLTALPEECGGVAGVPGDADGDASWHRTPWSIGSAREGEFMGVGGVGGIRHCHYRLLDSRASAGEAESNPRGVQRVRRTDGTQAFDWRELGREFRHGRDHRAGEGC